MALQRGSLKHIPFSRPVLSFHIAMAFVFNSFDFGRRRAWSSAVMAMAFVFNSFNFFNSFNS